MKIITLIIGIILFLIGAMLQHENKDSSTGWCFIVGGAILWGMSAY